MKKNIKEEFIYFPPLFRKWDYEEDTPFIEGKEVYVGKYPPFKRGKLKKDMDTGDITNYMYSIKDVEDD